MHFLLFKDTIVTMVKDIARGLAKEGTMEVIVGGTVEVIVGDIVEAIMEGITIMDMVRDTKGFIIIRDLVNLNRSKLFSYLGAMTK